MPGYSVPGVVPPSTEDEDERRRREQGELNRSANEAANAAYAAQQASAQPEPPPAAPAPVDELAAAREMVAAAGGALPLPGNLPIQQLPPKTGKGEKAPESTAAPVATVTTRAGNMAVQTPLAPGGDIEQKTVRSGQTRSKVELAKGELEQQRKIEATNAAIEENAQKARDQAVAAAEADADAAEKVRDIQATKAGDIERRTADVENEVARRTAEATKAEDDWKRALVDSENAKRTFWARQDTDTKVRAGISLLLGIVGGLTDGSNVGAERIHKAIEDDSAAFRKRAENRLAILERSKGNVEEAKRNLKWQLELVDLRTAAALDSAASQAVARAKRLGIQDAEIAGNQKILDLRNEAQTLKQKWLEGQRTKVESEYSQSRVVTDAGPGGGAGDKPLAKWSQGEKDADGFAQRMHRASQDMDRYRYTPSDISAIQNAMLMEQTLPKGAMAVKNRFLGTVFERLSPEGKKRFLAEQDFARAVLRKESGAAIGIQEQQAEIEGLGERPGDTPDTLAQKRQQRLGRVQAVGTSSGRPGYWSQQVAAQPGGPAGPPATSGQTRVQSADVARLQRGLERARAAGDAAAVQELEAEIARRGSR